MKLLIPSNIRLDIIYGGLDENFKSVLTLAVSFSNTKLFTFENGATKSGVVTVLL